MIGDTSKLDEDLISGLDIVEGSNACLSRSRAQTGSSILWTLSLEVGADKIKVGHGNFAIIAGPCSVESEGSDHLRGQKRQGRRSYSCPGGAFKPRTSPMTSRD